jgi:multicomponent Na+:H+ antiporter subunit C
MTAILLGLLVSVLFGCGTYLIMQRGQIRLILGLALFTHAVNLTLFGTGKLTKGSPPILPHDGDLATILATRTFADPLPQALILTAIVISFGVTAFIVVLVSRRDAFTGSDLAPGELARVLSSPDPFHVDPDHPSPMDNADDYDIFQFEPEEYGVRAYDLYQEELDEVYDRPEAKAEFAHEVLPETGGTDDVTSDYDGPPLEDGPGASAPNSGAKPGGAG